MAEMGTKLDIILEGIRQSEDYLLEKKRRINEVQEQITRHRAECLKIEKESSQLEDQQRVCKFQLLELETQLNSDHLRKTKLEDQATLTEEEAELEFQKLESEEASREEKTELLVKAAVNFNARVRLDNKDIPARREAIKLEQQQLELEKTQLLCEIKVMEDNKREEESLQKTAQELQNIIYELDRSVGSLESDLRNQLALAHHEKDRLLNPNRPPIKRLRSEIASGKEEGEYLESALQAMQREHQELSKLLWMKENAPPRHPAGIVEPRSRPRQKPCNIVSPQQHRYRFRARSSGDRRSSDAKVRGGVSQDDSWSITGNNGGVLQDASWSTAGNSGVLQDASWSTTGNNGGLLQDASSSTAGNNGGVLQDASWSTAGNNGGVFQDASWSTAGNNGRLLQDASSSTAGNNGGVSQDASWSAAGNTSGVSRDISWSAAGNNSGVSQDVSWSEAGNNGGVSREVSWSEAENPQSAESQEMDWSQMEGLDWSSLGAEGPKSAGIGVTKVSADGTTQSKNVSSARSGNRDAIRASRGEPTPSTPRTFTRNPAPPTPQSQVESRSKLPLHLLGHFVCVNKARKDSDEESGGESSVHEEDTIVTEESSVSVETPSVSTCQGSSVPGLKSSSATTSSHLVSDDPPPEVHAQEPTPSKPQESVLEKRSKSLSASKRPPAENTSEESQGILEQSSSSDNAFSFAPGWASMSVSQAKEDTSRPSTSQYSESESTSCRNTQGNPGMLHFKFKKTTVVHVQDYQEEQRSENSGHPYQRYSSRNQRRHANFPRAPYSHTQTSWSHRSHSSHRNNRSRQPNTERAWNVHQKSSNSQDNEYTNTDTPNDFDVPNRYSDWKNQGGRKIRFNDQDELLRTPQSDSS